MKFEKENQFQLWVPKSDSMILQKKSVLESNDQNRQQVTSKQSEELVRTDKDCWVQCPTLTCELKVLFPSGNSSTASKYTQ